MTTPQPIELLAPAKNADTAIEAIRHGADAAYIGAPKFGARAAAGNSIADIARAVEYAHIFGAKIYATVNTILYDNELRDAEQMIRQLYKAGVDALIVQDMGILRLDIPPIQLHASTQCDTRTLEKAKFLEAVGFSQIVLARELTIPEIRQIAANTNVPIECFIHGALCVSYSGRCHASCALKGRSANRGECAQICRLPFDLTDSKGKPVLRNRHLLSLQDLNQSDRILQLLEAGVSSLKIEGRLKEISYVKNVTAFYNNILNDICQKNPDKYQRASYGNVSLRFRPALEKSFNRGFTHYFTDSRTPQENMASTFTPKSIGEPIGKVRNSHRNQITVDTAKQLANGDGLVFFNGKSELEGFRVNTTEGNRITALENIRITPGTVLYRNYDKLFTDLLAGNTAERKLKISIRMKKIPEGIATEITDEAAHCITIRTAVETAVAKTDQTEARTRIFSKLGNTPYLLQSFVSGDTADLFIPASTLSEIRRKAIDLLSRSTKTTYRFSYRKDENRTVPFPKTKLDFADNVSNRLSAGFYHEHGVSEIEPAMETSGKIPDGEILMTTRYCIRRELGCCLKSRTRRFDLDQDLILSSGSIRLKVVFDCKNCEMQLRKA